VNKRLGKRCEKWQERLVGQNESLSDGVIPDKEYLKEIRKWLKIKHSQRERRPGMK
jgi:hypothetical protein